MDRNFSSQQWTHPGSTAITLSLERWSRAWMWLQKYETELSLPVVIDLFSNKCLD